MPEPETPGKTAPVAAPAAAPAAAPVPPATSAGTEGTGMEPNGFMAKMMGAFKEAMELELVKFRADLQKQISQIVKEQQDLAVEALKAGLGIQKDTMIHMSELPGMVRKIMLDSGQVEKRTDNPITDVPTAGATDGAIQKSAAAGGAPEIENRLQAMMKGRAAF